MVYSFIKVYEMDFTETVFECVANDLHQALSNMAKVMDAASLNKYVIWQRGWDITPVVRLFLSRLEREILLLASENHTAM